MTGRSGRWRSRRYPRLCQAPPRLDSATANPDLVRRVLTIYETARKWSASHPAELNAALAAAAHLPEPVIGRQLQRTDLSSGRIGDTQAQTIIAAGLLASHSFPVSNGLVFIKLSIRSRAQRSSLFGPSALLAADGGTVDVCASMATFDVFKLLTMAVFSFQSPCSRSPRSCLAAGPAV